MKPKSKLKEAVLTLENNTSHRLRVTVHLPKKYCPAYGCLTGESVEKDSPIIKLKGSGLWWLNTICRSNNGIKVSIDGMCRNNKKEGEQK